MSVNNALTRVTTVTGVRPNEQPGDLEAGEGAHVTVVMTECLFWQGSETVNVLTWQNCWVQNKKDYIKVCVKILGNPNSAFQEIRDSHNTV